MEGLTIILMRIILRNVDEHDDNHLDNDIHNGDDNNYGNNNTSGGVRVRVHLASVGHYLWSLWFYMEVINLLLTHHNTEVRQKKATVQHVMYGHSSKC